MARISLIGFLTLLSYVTPSASSPARAATSVPTALILYDTSGAFGGLGELYATYAANLVGHFGTYKAEPVATYTAGEIANYTTAIYVGSSYNEPIPPAFMSDLLTLSTPVIWLGYNIWEPMEFDFNGFVGRYGFGSPSLDNSEITTVLYKGSSLTRFIGNWGGVMSFGIYDSSKVTAVAEAVRADGTKLPWAIRASNLTYFAEVPFPFAQETDRVHIFEDVLFDALSPCAPTRHRAIVRLEDILPTDDPKVLRDTVDYLSSQGVPFGLAVVSQFNDPLGVIEKPGTVIHLKDRPQMVKTLQYAQSKGGVIIEHGLTHQYSNVRNPYNGLSADDGEFYIFTVNPDNTLNYIRPVPEDSQAWASGRVAAADKEFTNAKLAAPSIWTTPHYGASAIDYKVFSSRFAARWERALYFPGLLSGAPIDNTTFIGMYFPYRVRDVYGGKVLPEDAGSYETEPPLHLVPDILAAARANLVVRDGVVGHFYHPFRGLTPLKQIVSGIKALGYTYVSPTTVMNEQYGPYSPCFAPVVTATGGNGRVDLSWTLRSDGGATISSYKVYRGTTPGSETLLATLGDVKTYTDSAVTNGTTYYYKVSATNSVGSSPLSAEVSARTVSAPVLSASAGNAMVRLSWTIPTDMGAPITGYNIYRGTSSGSETKIVDLAGPPPYDDTTASNGTTYYYYVRAVTATSIGPPSNEVIATPVAPGVPGAAVLTATKGTGVVHLSWTVPTNGGSALWGYQVYRGTTSGGETILAWPGLITSYDDTTVIVGRTYYYQVTAINIAGEGPRSNEVSANFPAAVPSAPVVSASAGSGVVHLSWSAPNDGGSPITGYTINRGTTTGGETLLTTVGAVNAFDDTTVTNGTFYYYTVNATNVVGSSPPSSEVSAHPVSAPVLSASAGNTTVRLSWTAPTDMGSPILGYDVYRGTSSGSESRIAHLAGSSPFDDSGLVNGTTYYYYVRAVTALQESAASNEVNATPGAPTAPSAPVLSATSGPGVVHLTWTVPSNGGSGLWGYIVYRGNSSGSESIYAYPGNVTSFDDVTSAGATHYYQVTAVNAVGESSRSNEISRAAS